MAVLLVLGLSIASRTTQEIQLSDQEQDSTRVFNAAETGIEEALSNTTNFTQADGGTTVNGIISNLNDTTITGNYTVTRQDGLQTKIVQGASATIFLDQLGGTSFDVDWAKEAACNSRASLVYSIHYNEAGTEKVQYEAVKPNCNPVDGTYDINKAVGFSTTGVTAISGDYKQRLRIDLAGIPGTKKMVRIKALYADADVSVTGVPAQAYNIRSEATDGSDSNGEKSAIQVTRTKPAPPLVLDYAVYSGGSLEK
jgi:Tfp pilus assembly protein PilX